MVTSGVTVGTLGAEGVGTAAAAAAVVVLTCAEGAETAVERVAGRGILIGCVLAGKRRTDTLAEMSKDTALIELTTNTNLAEAQSSSSASAVDDYMG
jgi:hypothetical protein